MKRKTSLSDMYNMSGFRAKKRLKGIFGDKESRVIVLQRRQKKQHVRFVERSNQITMIVGVDKYETYPVQEQGYI